ncbi:hypothetical protein DNHGIG_03250 [Collibacillus ludicampi]|uniref:Uncharacterized protein n=1 Tax=Collibacillus ludicampi TaxID=2771369 RepID=A0AAV4LAH5_9BACL|nr:hypothetical protein DNHGIG_03250 [Collibacillus ludicampi]
MDDTQTVRSTILDTGNTGVSDTDNREDLDRGLEAELAMVTESESACIQCPHRPVDTYHGKES